MLSAGGPSRVIPLLSGKGVAVTVGWLVGLGKTAVSCAGSVGETAAGVRVGGAAVAVVVGRDVGWMETTVCGLESRLIAAKMKSSTMSGINM